MGAIVGAVSTTTVRNSPSWCAIRIGVLANGRGMDSMDYSAKLNLNVKVLDFVQFGGSERTVLRTFRWEVPI